MVKDTDIPYLSVLGHMLTVVSSDQEEYSGAVALISYDGYRVWGCGLCSHDNSRDGMLVRESKTRSVILHYFRTKSQATTR